MDERKALNEDSHGWSAQLTYDLTREILLYGCPADFTEWDKSGFVFLEHMKQSTALCQKSDEELRAMRAYGRELGIICEHDNPAPQVVRERARALFHVAADRWFDAAVALKKA